MKIVRNNTHVGFQFVLKDLQNTAGDESEQFFALVNRFAHEYIPFRTVRFCFTEDGAIWNILIDATLYGLMPNELQNILKSCKINLETY